jgi:hypothetical protein
VVQATTTQLVIWHAIWDRLLRQPGTQGNSSLGRLLQVIYIGVPLSQIGEATFTPWKSPARSIPGDVCSQDVCRILFQEAIAESSGYCYVVLNSFNYLGLTSGGCKGR